MTQLTTRQAKILQFIADFVEENGYPPSIREIGQKFKIETLRGVTVHLDALQRKGYIERSSNPRSIRIIHPDYQTRPNVKMIPLVGTIAAGTPITAQENIEGMVPVPLEMVKSLKNAFVLRVKGDSMIGEGIMPRDLVVVKPQHNATHGDLVAVMIEDEATVKRIRFERDRVRLMPSNPNYEPIEVKQNDAHVIGKIVGLMRDYQGMAF